MRKIILFNKPYNTLCQFTSDNSEISTLADFIDISNVYAAGRLDKDSEGLLVLTNDGYLQHKISHPRYKAKKTYWVQVEGAPTQESISRLRKGVKLKEGMTKPAQAHLIAEPNLWPRHPPFDFGNQFPLAGSK